MDENFCFVFDEKKTTTFENAIVWIKPTSSCAVLGTPFVHLRTVPTIVIAHTFCASRDTRISYRRCLLIQGYFCAFENYAEKSERSKSSWHPKRKLGVGIHFSEIIKLQFGKERHTLLCILTLFTNVVD